MTTATARFQDKREAILDGAARLFNQQGINGGTLADVARGVGLAANSLTYYYRRKEDLACACLERAMEALVAAADAAVNDGGIEARVRGFLRRYLGLLAAIAQGRHPELILLGELLTLPAPHDAALAAAYNQMFRRVRRLLDAPDGPALDAPARNARAHLLLSTVAWTRAWIARHEPDDYTDIGERIADLLLWGLASGRHAPLAASVDLPWHEIDGEEGDASGTRSAYLKAATRLVNEHGYRGASVDRIAAELKLTKGSFYHHHETKEDLVTACFERTFAVMRAAQQAAMQAPGNGRDRLATACRALLEFQLSGHGPMLRVTAWSGLPEAIRSDMRRTMGRLGERFATLVLQGMQDGSLRVIDPSTAAQVLNGMVNAAAEIERWVRGIHAGNAFELYAIAVFTGLAAGAPATSR
jgi:AcrR family transcriptional regulator